VAVTDNRSDHQNYPLPNARNNMRDDVARIIAALIAIDGDMFARASKDSPTFTGTPKAPSPAAGDKSDLIPNTSWVAASIASAVANLVASSPGTLDTLKELADALGDDPNFATTVATQIAGKQAKSDALTAITANGAPGTAGLALLAMASYAAVKAALQITTADISDLSTVLTARDAATRKYAKKHALLGV
jgi:phage-related tail fiber protein